MAARVPVAFLVVTLLSTILMSAQTSPAIGHQVSLGERIACQMAIEEVYWRHGGLIYDATANFHLLSVKENRSVRCTPAVLVQTLQCLVITFWPFARDNLLTRAPCELACLLRRGFVTGS